MKHLLAPGEEVNVASVVLGVQLGEELLQALISAVAELPPVHLRAGIGS